MAFNLAEVKRAKEKKIFKIVYVAKCKLNHSVSTAELDIDVITIGKKKNLSFGKSNSSYFSLNRKLCLL